MKNTTSQSSTQITWLAAFVLAAFLILPQSAGAAPQSGQLIVFVQPDSSPVNDRFRQHTLPEIRKLAAAMGGNSLSHFQSSLAFWSRDGAMQTVIHRSDGEHLDFDVVRCRYAEMYHALGIAELGKTLSCNRDFALIEGFNAEARLSRTQTLVEGAAHCDFRYRFP